MNITRIVNVRAEVTSDSENNITRYSFELIADGGEASRSLIVDVPNEDSGTCDVWVVGPESVVMVGDTPEDGFATFTPKEVETVGCSCGMADLGAPGHDHSGS
jgi:hypothetical protein